MSAPPPRRREIGRREIGRREIDRHVQARFSQGRIRRAPGAGAPGDRRGQARLDAPVPPGFDPLADRQRRQELSGLPMPCGGGRGETAGDLRARRRAQRIPERHAGRRGQDLGRARARGSRRRLRAAGRRPRIEAPARRHGGASLLHAPPSLCQAQEPARRRACRRANEPRPRSEDGQVATGAGLYPAVERDRRPSGAWRAATSAMSNTAPPTGATPRPSAGSSRSAPRRRACASSTAWCAQRPTP